MKPERVIFRADKNPYLPKDTPCFLAAFPDEEAWRGRIAATPFYFDGHGTAWFEPYEEISDRYYYGTKIVHKNDPCIPLLLNAIREYYGADFVVCEKR